MALNLAERILARRIEGEKVATASYVELVKAAADGHPYDDGQADEILRATGKSVEDFERDVQTLTDRRRWAADLALEAGAQAELRALQAERDGIEAEHIAFRRQLAQRHDALEAREREARDKLTRATAARERLLSTAPPDLLQRICSLHAEAKRLDDQATEIRTNGKRGAEQNLRIAVDNFVGHSPQRLQYERLSYREQEEFAGEDPGVRAARQRVEMWERQATELEGQARELRRQAAELEPLQFQA